MSDSICIIICVRYISTQNLYNNTKEYGEMNNYSRAVGMNYLCEYKQISDAVCFICLFGDVVLCVCVCWISFYKWTISVGIFLLENSVCW